MDDTLLGIGQMAKATGLTISALRFYDGASVLVPAVVDPATGYRLYRENQLPDGRLIAQLRRVAMPLRDVRRILAARSQPAEVATIIDTHLRRLEAGLQDAKRVLSTVQHSLHDRETAVQAMPDPLSALSDRHLHSGKVRDLFTADDGSLLMVTTDRISAFDHVLPTEIPDKGRILCQLSLWWFRHLADLVPNHVITADVADYPQEFAPHSRALRGQSVLCQRLDMIPIECVARGYLAGSAWSTYQRTGSAHGIDLPPGLLEGQPATRADLHADHKGPGRSARRPDDLRRRCRRRRCGAS